MGAIFNLLFVVLVVVGVFGAAAVFIARNLIYLCGPNEVLVFSGGRHRLDEKRTVGYRLIQGGRGLRIPLLETVDRIDLTNMIIEVTVHNAYSLGGIPLSVSGVANVKVASHRPALDNALERFLGMRREEIIRIAKDTLEGNLRGVLSQLTPEEVNNDKLAFADKLLEEADHDLGKLGLVLDTLKIQNVSDDRGYLDSIGRKQSAEIIKSSRIAEAEAKAQSTQQDAENTRKAQLATINAKMQVIKAETERRIKDSQTRRKAMVAEQIGEVKALIARSKADVEVQKARVEQVKRRLQADVIAPAQAEMEAARARAKGDAAKVIEDGKATVAVLEDMIATWKNGGENAREIFLMQKLQTLMESLVSTISDVQIDKVTVLPPQQQGGGPRTAVQAVTLVEELKGALGVDIPQLIEQVADRRQLTDRS
ncbi:MAG: SPFH domain-containing protein [Myxococcota bacterium]